MAVVKRASFVVSASGMARRVLMVGKVVSTGSYDFYWRAAKETKEVRWLPRETGVTGLS